MEISIKEIASERQERNTGASLSYGHYELLPMGANEHRGPSAFPLVLSPFLAALLEAELKAALVILPGLVRSWVLLSASKQKQKCGGGGDGAAQAQGSCSPRANQHLCRMCC